MVAIAQSLDYPTPESLIHSAAAAERSPVIEERSDEAKAASPALSGSGESFAVYAVRERNNTPRRSPPRKTTPRQNRTILVLDHPQ
jgi:hypothetical protein